MSADATLNDEEEGLSASLAGLVTVSGRLFTLIRARTWDAGKNPETMRAAIDDIMSWSDAAHNLSVIGHHVLQKNQDPERMLRDVQGLVRSLEATADRAEKSWTLVAGTLREASRLVSLVGEQVSMTTPPNTTEAGDDAPDINP